jgi:hypothetical protein
MFSTPSGHARPDYKKQFDATYKGSKISKAAEEAKCEVCHVGKDKKSRNDYGKALAKILSAKSYEAMKGDKKALAKKVEEALKSVAAEKSPDGKTFGELIEAGVLPGKVAAAKKKETK